MTVLKIQGRPAAVAMQAIAPHVQRLYDRTGIRVMAVVEMAHVERTEPAPDSEKEATVTMRISHLEIPSADQENVVREVQQALYLQRTSEGTLDESGRLELSDQTLGRAAGMVHAIAAARLMAGARHWEAYTRRVCASGLLTVGELHHELDAIAEGLRALHEGTVE
jgi:hypothetical protein